MQCTAQICNLHNRSSVVCIQNSWKNIKAALLSVAMIFITNCTHTMANDQNLTNIIINIFLVRQAFRPKTAKQQKPEDDAQAKKIKVEADIENKGFTSLYICKHW